MKIIVTGGAGFIGSHLVRALLQERCHVTILDNFNSFYDPAIKRANVATCFAYATRGLCLEVAVIDLCDWKSVSDLFRQVMPDAVFHLAARAGVRHSILNPSSYIETNITGTYNILEAARLVDCQKVIFFSSSAVYGNSKKNPFCEDTIGSQTLSPYASTKVAGENFCGNYAHLYGMRIIVLRLFTVYGPGQRPDLAIHTFIDAIENGHPIKQFGDGTTCRDYTYIEDIIQGVMGAFSFLQGDGSLFEIFNLGGNKSVMLRDMIDGVEKALGKKANIERFPEQQGDMSMTVADITKARSLLGYSPQTLILDGIQKFVTWYRAIHR